MNEIDRDISIEQVDYNIDINSENYSIDIQSQPAFEIQLNEQGPQGARGYTGTGISIINLEYQRGNIDVYRILLTNGEEYYFSVTNGLPGPTGNGIDYIEKTNTSGNVDTYTIYYTDGGEDEFTVTNGVNGSDGVGVDSVTLDYTSGLDKYYHMNFTDGLYYEYVVTDGKDGTDGVDGYSPTATVSKSGDTATISITDINGTTTATVKDGATGDTGNGIDRIDLTGYSSDMLTKYYRMWFTNLEYFDFSITDGKNGTNGTNGTDGYSPTATVTQTGTGATITITDKNGTTTANISNGLDGFDGIDGRSATITGATASVTNTVGTPSVTVTSGGTEFARSFNFAFSNLKGDKGDKGDTGDPGEVTTAQLQSALDTKQDTLMAGTDLEIIKGSSTHNLPEGYTEVEYIQADGDAGIITSVAGNINTNVTLIANCTRTTTASQVIISDGYDGNGGTYFGQPSNKSTWGAGANGSQITSLNVLTKTEFNISSTITNTFVLDGTVSQGQVVQTFSRTGTVSVTDNYSNWSLFGSINRGSNTIAYPTYGKVFYAKFEQNNTVVAEYIPAIRNSDNTVGLYDIVNDTFIARNLGTGTLMAGEKVAETATINFVNETGYITGIGSSDVTTALGYIPYNSSNPNGYTSNVGTVTSVNNVQPVNGNVNISIPSAVTESTVAGWGFTKNAGTVTSVNNIQPVNGNVTITIPTVPTNVSAFNNDAGYITSSALNGYATQAWVGQQGYLTSSSIANMQTTGNLVTSISSSSTDSQYPSAKCMYDIIGDIETLLQAV